jgi:hypothetical protein
LAARCRLAARSMRWGGAHGDRMAPARRGTLRVAVVHVWFGENLLDSVLHVNRRQCLWLAGGDAVCVGARMASAHVIFRRKTQSGGKKWDAPAHVILGSPGQAVPHLAGGLVCVSGAQRKSRIE